jgi:hypothetical protein
MNMQVVRAHARARELESPGARARSFSLCFLAACGERPPVEVEPVADRVRQESRGQGGSSAHFSHVRQMKQDLGSNLQVF